MGGPFQSDRECQSGPTEETVLVLTSDRFGLPGSDRFGLLVCLGQRLNEKKVGLPLKTLIDHSCNFICNRHAYTASTITGTIGRMCEVRTPSANANVTSMNPAFWSRFSDRLTRRAGTPVSLPTFHKRWPSGTTLKIRKSDSTRLLLGWVRSWASSYENDLRSIQAPE